MKAEKKKIFTLNKCYAVAPFDYDGEKRLVCAAEKSDPAYVFDYAGNMVEKLWDGPGGVMTLLQWPNEEKILLATQRFFSPNDSADASIVYYQYENGEWKCNVLCRLPFVHRFGFLERGGELYLIACTIKSAHAFKNDWTCPGRIWVARMERDIHVYSQDNPLQLTPLMSGLYKNHGFQKCYEKDFSFAVVGTENGAFQVLPPKDPSAEWTVTKLMEDPVSDMLYLDFDGDGKRELLTISPFHGDTLSLYKEEEGSFKKIRVWEEKMPFSHAIWGEKIEGRYYAFIGCREGERELKAISFDEERKEYIAEEIDRGSGAANCLYFNDQGTHKLLAANRESNEVAIYTLSF